WRQANPCLGLTITRFFLEARPDALRQPVEPNRSIILSDGKVVKRSFPKSLQDGFGFVVRRVADLFGDLGDGVVVQGEFGSNGVWVFLAQVFEPPSGLGLTV